MTYLQTVMFIVQRNTLSKLAEPKCPTEHFLRSVALHRRRRRRLERYPLQIRHKQYWGQRFILLLMYCLNQMLAVMLLSQHRVSSFKTVRPRASCGARCMGHAIRHGLRFAQRHHSRNLVKERDPICACTNKIAQHQSKGG